MAMPDCCMASFVATGFASGFRAGERGERHTCPACGRVYVLKSEPTDDAHAVPGYKHLRWRLEEVTH